jgi:hypothetical protein
MDDNGSIPFVQVIATPRRQQTSLQHLPTSTLQNDTSPALAEKTFLQICLVPNRSSHSISRRYYISSTRTIKGIGLPMDSIDRSYDDIRDYKQTSELTLTDRLPSDTHNSNTNRNYPPQHYKLTHRQIRQHSDGRCPDSTRGGPGRVRNQRVYDQRMVNARPGPTQSLLSEYRG